MNSLTFFATGIPKGQPRVKAYRRGNITGVYDPGTADDWKSCILLAAKQVVQSSNGAQLPLFPDGPLCVDIEYIFPRPKSHFTAKMAIKPAAPSWHTAKPDRDNLDKAVLDTLTLAQFWRDDAVVADGRTTKRFAAIGEGTGCKITIKSLA